MRKTHIRDYATEAFRFFARTGSSQKYCEALEMDIQRGGGNGLSDPTVGELILRETARENHLAEILDLTAVERTFAILRTMKNGSDIIRAVQIVYMRHPERNVKRGEISKRVTEVVLDCFVCEWQVYNWLATAREIFAIERGLRCE